MVLAMTDSGPLSGLILEVAEAEPAVASHRQRLDANAGLGIPAHITVLFPFMPPEEISSPVLASLEGLFAAVSRFCFQLDRSDWFGTDVLWLGPHDPKPFQALTRTVTREFPAFLPYEGQFGEPVPHLTVGHGRPITDLRAAEQAVNAHLPIDARATAVTLMTQQSAAGPWTRAATFALA
jgi:2'-5' RNA ligase